MQVKKDDERNGKTTQLKLSCTRNYAVEEKTQAIDDCDSKYA